jgi:hypothetical protein
MSLLVDEVFQVVLDPSEVAFQRTALPLNTDAGGIRIGSQGIDWGDAAVTAFMADQQVGSAAVGYRIPNRTISIPLALGMNELDNFDTALSTLKMKVGLIQAEGGWLMRQAGFYADVVNATLTVPDMLGEWADLEDGASLQLECLPDFYGDEVDLGTFTFVPGNDEWVQEITGLVQGEYPARVRLVVTDTTGVAPGAPGGGIEGVGAASVLWGFWSRNAPQSNKHLTFSSTRGNLMGLNGTTTSSSPPSGAYNSHVFENSNASTAEESTEESLFWVPVLATLPSPDLVGSYQVWIRAYSKFIAPYFRLVWSQDNTPSQTANDPIYFPDTPDHWMLLPLGIVYLPPVPPDISAGAPSTWTGVVQVANPYGAEEAGFDVVIDELFLVPVDETAGLVSSITPPAASSLATGFSNFPDSAVPQGGTAQFTTKGMYRQPVGGEGVWAPSSIVFGDLPRLPVSGLEERPVYLFMRPSGQRLGINFPFDSSTDDQASGIETSVYYRPCYLGRG